jgi:hypothetical protein
MNYSRIADSQLEIGFFVGTVDFTAFAYEFVGGSGVVYVAETFFVWTSEVGYVGCSAGEEVSAD